MEVPGRCRREGRSRAPRLALLSTEIGYAIERQAGDTDSDSADPLAAIRSFRDQLQARGIRLLVVPVPNKESVYPGMLARRAEGAGSRRLLYRRAVCSNSSSSAASSTSTCSRCFAEPEQEESQSQPGRLYLAQDSHWSPAGARLAAAAVVRRGSIWASSIGVIALTSSVRSPSGATAIWLRCFGRRDRSVRSNRRVWSACKSFESDTRTPYRDGRNRRSWSWAIASCGFIEQDEPGAAGFIAHLARELRQPLDLDCQ